MYETRYVILTCIGFALVIALIYVKLMDWFAVPLAYFTIILIEVCFGVIGYYSYAYA